MAAGELKNMLDCIKWPLDYFMKAHPSKYEFYAQVGEHLIAIDTSRLQWQLKGKLFRIKEINAKIEPKFEIMDINRSKHQLRKENTVSITIQTPCLTCNRMFRRKG